MAAVRGPAATLRNLCAACHLTLRLTVLVVIFMPRTGMAADLGDYFQKEPGSCRPADRPLWLLPSTMHGGSPGGILAATARTALGRLPGQFELQSRKSEKRANRAVRNL